MNGHNNNDFRRTKIHPTVADINGQNEIKLSPNLIGQSYENSDHYFKTQFNLLREESVRPLVRDVNKLKELFSKAAEDEKAANERVAAEEDMTGRAAEGKQDRKQKFRETVDNEVQSNVYFDIRLETNIGVDFDMTYGSVLKFTFDYKAIEKIDLIDCQHLMNGGIMCLSSDKFQKSIIFGIIAKSQLRKVDQKTNERLWNFCLKLDFDNKSNNFYEFLLKPNTTYIGVESPSFFEGFRYSLKKLQNMSEDFPFSRYLVGIPKDIKSVPYLSVDSVYDMSCIKLQKKEEVNQSLDSDPKPNPLSSVELMNTDVYGEKRAYNRSTDQLKKCSTFDTKQFDAFYAALTKELCVIEGPPGTGKTFVGLKIVECLLNNSQVWNQSSQIRPILIVCYKNHALDQFLEGILKFNKKVVRIGGNSESKELEEYRLRTYEDQFREDLELQQQLKIKTEEDMENMTNGIKLLDTKLISKYKDLQKLRRRQYYVQDQIVALKMKIFDSFKRILDSEDITPFIKPMFLSKYFSNHSLTDWLNSQNDNNFPNICQKQLNKKRLSMEAFDEVSELVRRNVLELNAAEKWLLYLYWRELFLKKIQKEIQEKLQTLAKEMDKSVPKKVKFQQMLCKGAEVIGLTITGAAKYADLVKAFNPKIMIVEEAAEVLEGHVVAALSSTIEHLILIGDHKQLRPLTNVQELTDEYKLDVSLFERIIENKLSFIQLELQHRMRPCISELLKVGDIYDNLRNGERVQNYPNIEYTFGKNVYFIDHQHIEDNNMCRDIQDKSRSNLYEARLVVELVKYFLIRNYPEEKITVLTTYNAQLSLIRKLMFDQKDVFVKEVEIKTLKASKTKAKSLNQNPTEDCYEVKPEEKVKELRVRVSSVDGFQGEENDIIIISFVRSSKRNSIGFLGNKNRVNVALSRAKHALYCIGNFTIMAREEKTQMWSQIIKHLSEKGCFGEEFTIGCECTDQQNISMPGQLELFNHQLKNGRCNGTCLKQN